MRRRLKHEKLIEILHQINIDGKDILFIMNIYWKQRAAVNLLEELTEYQAVKRGMRQGCVISPHLLNAYSEMIDEY